MSRKHENALAQYLHAAASSKGGSRGGSKAGRGWETNVLMAVVLLAKRYTLGELFLDEVRNHHM